MDYLFDIESAACGSFGADCARCPAFSIGAKSYKEPFLVKTGTSTKKLLIVGSRVSKMAHMSGVPVMAEYLEPILNLLPSVYTVYYVPSISCYTERELTHELSIVGAKCCGQNVIDVVKQVKPDYVLLFDSPAIAAIYDKRVDKGCNAELWRGNRIPDQTLGCFVIPLLRYITPRQGSDNAHWLLIQEDLKLVDPNLAFPSFSIKIELTDAILQKLTAGDIIAFDYETTGLKPDNKGHRIYSASIYRLGDDTAYSFLVTETNIEKLKAVLNSREIKKIAHNIKMEERWSRKMLGIGVNGWLWDTCLGAHCINSTSGNSGLKFQALVNFGRDDYSKSVEQYLRAETSNGINTIYNCPIHSLLEYGAWDAYYCGLLYLKQREVLSARVNSIGLPFTYGVEFFTMVQRAFAVMEGTGIGLDTALMESNKTVITERRKVLETKFYKTGLYNTWQNVYKGETNIHSSTQLGKILFDTLGFDPPKLTGKGSYAVDIDALADVAHPDLVDYIRIKKYEKILGTYYSQFEREIDETGIIHCEMQLNTTRTFRTSCTNPNLQNISRSDKEQASFIRSLFKPQFKDYVIVEADLKGCEVSGAACHTRDKNLIAYVSDKTLDMHRDLSAVLYDVPKAQVTKELRSITKAYTFGSFFGSYYKLTGPLIFKMIGMQKPKLTDGTLVMDHLVSLGLGDSQVFTEHVQDTDNYMWNTQFPGYTKWKRWVYDQYLKNGYVDAFTGFRRYGPLGKNMVINTPIQCDSGHINLWLCCYVLSRIAKEDIPAKLFLQIHDSVVGMVHKDYVAEYCQLYKDGIEALKKQWAWMICPFEIEFEVAPVGGSWYEKKEFVL